MPYPVFILLSCQSLLDRLRVFHLSCFRDLFSPLRLCDLCVLCGEVFGSVVAGGVGLDVGAAEAGLEDREVDLIDVVVAFEVEPVAGRQRGRAGLGVADLEEREVFLIHITVTVEIPGY